MPQNILTTNYDVSQLFLGSNFYENRTYTNSTGSPVTIKRGTLVGTVLASAKILPTVSTATDGSQAPDGIYADDDVTVADGSTITLTVCTKGRVNKNNVIFFNGTDTWTTTAGAATTGGGTMERLLVRNTGIFLDASTELANYDN